MAILRVIEPFACDVDGVPHVFRAGDLVKSTDKVVKNRGRFFEDVENFVSTDNKRAPVEQATAAPGERRSLSRSAKKATAKKAAAKKAAAKKAAAKKAAATRAVPKDELPVGKAASGADDGEADPGTGAPKEGVTTDPGKGAPKDGVKTDTSGKD